jgi:hypothetical protein
MCLLQSVHTMDDVPVRLYESREAALADIANWRRADAGAASKFIGFRLIVFHDGVPDNNSYLFTEA